MLNLIGALLAFIAFAVALLMRVLARPAPLARTFWSKKNESVMSTSTVARAGLCIRTRRCLSTESGRITVMPDWAGGSAGALPA